ncbi:MAG: aspartate aminotransferase family protein [Myxococcaceae bacterium]
MGQNQEMMDRAKAHLLQNYRQQPICLERGSGVKVWDSDGKAYLDLLGGIATCSLGHCHPEVTAALKAQADKLWHVSNVFYTRPQIELAERLCTASNLTRAFFCNSGAEANEALIKLARRHQNEKGRHEIICFENSFHGRTLTTVSATGQPKYQKGFEPLTPGFVHVPYGELASVEKAINAKTAAILVEPIQGEGGVRVAPAGFLKALRKLCDEQGLLLLIDEVQTGMGRTGRPFAYQHEGILPDAFSLAKALGNGAPIGAMICQEEVGKSLPSGTHGSTFGGNLLAAAAANVVAKIVFDPKTLEEVRSKGEHLMTKARALQERKPDQIATVRGMGLLMGLEMKVDAGELVARCRDRGLLVNLAGEKTVRFAPPFVATLAELEEGIALFESALV